MKNGDSEESERRKAEEEGREGIVLRKTGSALTTATRWRQSSVPSSVHQWHAASVSTDTIFGNKALHEQRSDCSGYFTHMLPLAIS